MISRSSSLNTSTVFSDYSASHWQSKTGCRRIFNRRNFQSFLILCVSIVPVLTIVVQNSIFSRKAAEGIENNNIISKEIHVSLELGTAIHFLQIERGLSALYIGSGFDNSLFGQIASAYRNTDDAIDKISYWPNINGNSNAYYTTRQSFKRAVEQFRVVLFNQTIQSVIDFYTEKNTRLIKWTGVSIRKAANGDVWRNSVGYHLLILSKEQAGIERALGSTFFAKGGFSSSEEYRYHTRRYLGDSYLKQSKLYSKAIQERIDEHLDTDLGRIIEENRARILRNNESRPSVELGEIWFANLTSYLNILKQLQDDVAENLLNIIDGLSLSFQSQLTIAIIALVIPTILSPFIVVIINRLVSKMQHFNIVLRSKGDEERKERKRTQTLLYEMLPMSIARKLLSEEIVKPEFYHGVTLFFSDICGFNEIVLNSSPLQIIDMMNTIYRVFDSLLGDYDVYKVETIGDCYMVASGLPSPNDRHARELSNFALDVVGTFSTMTVPHQPRVYVMIRIGLNSGTAVAGVVGLKMPRYCIFGDTVNTASRMMSNGTAGRIHISESTKLQLDQKDEFIIESRGTVMVKGKGEMNTYWLNGRQIPPAKSPLLTFSVDEDALSCI